MPTPTPMSLLDLEIAPGRPPMVRTERADDPPAWAELNQPALRAIALEYGAVLVRGLGLSDPAGVEAVFRRIGGDLVIEREAFAARQTYAEGVYSSPTWPPNQPMCMHHELSYRTEVPGLLLVACLTAPTAGGATAVADAGAVLGELPPDLVERFERDGWLLTRSYHDDIGASVADAFGTDDPEAVERYCRTHGIEVEWLSDGGLRTRQRRPAVVRHPISNVRCWFNQVAFLSEWTMDLEVRDFLVDVYGPDRLPFATRFGNGDPIDPDVVRQINDVYDAHTVREPWHPGDLLVVDNVRAAHSREAYDGDREILVAMAEPFRPADGSTAVGRADQ